jgi:hypothetical protein
MKVKRRGGGGHDVLSSSRSVLRETELRSVISRKHCGVENSFLSAPSQSTPGDLPAVPALSGGVIASQLMAGYSAGQVVANSFRVYSGTSSLTATAQAC